MKSSKLFITSLLAAAAMSAVPAYAASLTDATLSIDAFTSAALTNLGTNGDGWAFTNISSADVSTGGVYTTTANQGTIGTGTSGASLTTNVPEGNTARNTFSVIFTVDKSVFTEGTPTKLINAAGGNLGVGTSGTSLSGYYQASPYQGGPTIADAASYADASTGLLTIGLVFNGGSSVGTSVYLLNSANGEVSSSKAAALKVNSETISFGLASAGGVSYSNLYWFNSALSTADMTAAMTTVGNGYVWAGTSSANTWNTESANTNWIKDGANVDFASGSSVIFGNAAESKTVAIDSAVTAGTITVLDDYTFTVGSGGSLAGTFSVAADKTATLNLTADSSISAGVSSGVVKKTGTGLLTYTGTISSGATLEIAEGGTTASPNLFSGTLSAGGNLIVSDGAVVQHTKTTNDGKFLKGNITITGDGSTFIQKGTNNCDQLDYNGTTSIAVKDGGTLALGSNRWTFRTNNSLSLDGGNITGSSQSGNGNLDFMEAKTVTVLNSYGKDSNISASIRLRNNVTFDVADGATLNITGKIGNATAGKKIIKTGAGKMTLDLRTYGDDESAPSENFTGGLDVNGGEVEVRHASALGSGAVTVNGDGSILDINLSSGTLAQGASQALTTTGAGKITVSAGALALAGAVNLSNAIEVGASGALTVAGTTVFVLNDSLLQNDATSAWDVITGNTSGITGWNDASLNIDNFRKADGSYFGGRSELGLSTAGTVTITDISYDLYWKGAAAGTWNKSDTAIFGKDSATGTGTAFVNGDNVTFATSGAVVAIGEAIRAGKITVSENTTFKLASGQNQALSAAGIEVASGANLQLEGSVLGSITGGINLVAADSVVTLKDSAPPNGNQFYGSGKVVLNQTLSSAFGIAASVFTGDISLEKIGVGTVNLNAAQTYNGNTTVSEGALNVSAALTTTGKLTVARDASMTFSAAGTFTQLSGEGRIDLGSTGSLALSNTGAAKFDNWTGTVKLSDRTTHIALNNYGTNGSTIELAGFQSYFDEGAGSTVAANIVLKTTTTNDFGAKIKNGWTGKTITFSGAISGDGKFMYTGEGVGANNTVVQTFLFTGDVSAFSGGFVQTPASNNKATSILQFGNGGASVAAADASVSGTGEIAWNGKSVVYNYSSDVLASNKITSAALIKQGTGSLTLTGDNTYTGGTTVSAGRLIAGSNSALGTTGATTVAANAELGIAFGVTITNAGEIQLSQGAKLVVDLSGKATATETFTLDLVSGTALKYNGAAFDEDCTSLISEGIVVLKNMNLNGWTQSLSYSGNTLQLTMTIPEPSMFGLLAGLGALALAGTRRRRKKA